MSPIRSIRSSALLLGVFRSPALCPHTTMDAYSKMMAAARKAAKKTAEEKKSKIVCPNCDATFPNQGALSQHCKFKHRAKSDVKKNQPKLGFETQSSSSSSLPQSTVGVKRKCPATPPRKPPSAPKTPSPKKRHKKKKQKTPSPKKAKIRVRYSNAKKYALILAYEELKQKDPLNCTMLFEIQHPSCSIHTVRKWATPQQRECIKQDALSPNPKIRDAKLSADALKRYFEGAFPKEETELYDMLGNRRADGKRASARWLKAKMRHVVKLRVEKEKAQHAHSEAEKQRRARLLKRAKTFRASRGWFHRWKARFQVSLRRQTNTKAKSAQERLPKVQKFHRTVKQMCQPPPKQDDTYGRFTGNNRFHVDQVPLEFGGSDTTYDKKGTKRVHVKKAKVDMERRVASLQLCFTAEGAQRVKPGICFRAKPAIRADGSADPSRPQHANLKKDLRQMPKGIDVYFQPKAWFDTATSLQFAKNFRNQARPANQEKLLGLDNLNSQCAPEFIDTMRKAKVQLIYTPADCTDLCAVTDAVSSFL